MKKFTFPIIIILILSITQGYGQQAASTYFTHKSEQEVIDMLTNGGFKILNSLKSLPDTLIGETLLCNGYNVLGEKSTVNNMDLITFTGGNSFQTEFSGDFNKFLDCKTIRYVFDAENLITSCLVFVCNEGISIYVYSPQTDILPASFMVFLPNTTGGKSLQLFATFTLAGVKKNELLKKQNFKFGTGTTYADVKSSPAVVSEYDKISLIDLVIMVKKDNINGIKALFAARPGFLSTEHASDASYYVDRPLMQAVMQKKTEIIKLLIENGADVNEREQIPYGDAILYSVTYDKDRYFNIYECIPKDADYEKIFQLLVGKIKLDDALSSGVEFANIDLLNALKKFHAEFAAKNLSPYLDGAIYYGQIESVKWLMDNGADPFWKNKDNISMLDLGLKSKSKEIKAYFKEIKNKK